MPPILLGSPTVAQPPHSVPRSAREEPRTRREEATGEARRARMARLYFSARGRSNSRPASPTHGLGGGRPVAILVLSMLTTRERPCGLGALAEGHRLGALASVHRVGERTLRAGELRLRAIERGERAPLGRPRAHELVAQARLEALGRDHSPGPSRSRPRLEARARGLAELVVERAAGRLGRSRGTARLRSRASRERERTTQLELASASQAEQDLLGRA